MVYTRHVVWVAIAVPLRVPVNIRTVDTGLVVMLVSPVAEILV